MILSAPLYAVEHEGWAESHFNNENGLPQNSVMFIQMDNDGYLWLATQAGIVRYDGQHFRLFDNSNSGLQSNRYTRLGKDSAGRIYCMDEYCKTAFYNPPAGFSKPAFIPGLVTSPDGGLIDLDRIDMGKLAPFTHRYAKEPYADAFYFTYHGISKGKGFIQFYNTVGYISNGKVRRTDSLHIHPATYCSTGRIGSKLCYVGTDREIVFIDTNGVSIHKKIPVALPWVTLQPGMANITFFQQESQLLVNADGKIYEIRLAGDDVAFRLLIDATDIPLITSVRYYPEKGLLAIGSNTQGLYLFKKQQLTATGKNIPSADAFYAIAPYGNDRVVAASGTIPNSPTLPGIVDALNRFCVLRDRKRHYWYGSRCTLLETDSQLHVLKKIPLPAWAQCVQEDGPGNIWLVCGPNGFGHIGEDTFQPYKLDSVGEKQVYSFIHAGNQTFWLVGRGLCMWLDVKNHRQKIYHEFDSVELRTAYLDRQDNLWLGSYGQGYFLFRKGRFMKMPEDEAHYLKVVNCFLEDRKGFMWMTTNNGLFQCSVNDLYRYMMGNTGHIYHYYYGKESGLKISEFNGGCTPSGIELSDGRFAFPSMNGVVLFHPDSVKPLLPGSKLFIEDILLDGVAVNEAELSALPPFFKRLELTVSTPYFGNLRNLNIQYNIDGLDDRWYPLGDNNRIVLNRLKYGSYQLRLRKEAGFGTGSYITRELPFTVLPFFYQTWWFRITVAIGIAVLVLLVTRLRYRYLIRQRNRLEAEVKNRTSALVYHNRLLEKLTVMIAHDLKSPLHFLSKVTGHLRSKVQQENLEGIDRTSGEIKHTADQVYQFIEEFNLWVSSFSESFAINHASFDLCMLLQELELYFKEMVAANGNTLSIVTPANYILYTDRELLKIILRNIIDNANKHAKPCDVRISVHATTEQNILITIADTGEGMTRPALKRIQERITYASTAAGIERNSRMGYQMIIDFATLLGLKIDVQSEPGKGTAVTLRMRGKINETSMSQGSIEQAVSAG